MRRAIFHFCHGYAAIYLAWIFALCADFHLSRIHTNCWSALAKQAKESENRRLVSFQEESSISQICIIEKCGCEWWSVSKTCVHARIHMLSDKLSAPEREALHFGRFVLIGMSAFVTRCIILSRQVVSVESVCVEIKDKSKWGEAVQLLLLRPTGCQVKGTAYETKEWIFMSKRWLLHLHHACVTRLASKISRRRDSMTRTAYMDFATKHKMPKVYRNAMYPNGM